MIPKRYTERNREFLGAEVFDTLQVPEKTPDERLTFNHFQPGVLGEWSSVVVVKGVFNKGLVAGFIIPTSGKLTSCMIGLNHESRENYRIYLELITNTGVITQEVQSTGRVTELNLDWEVSKGLLDIYIVAEDLTKFSNIHTLVILNIPSGGGYAS